ncbi:MAG TPA: hypothetical protein VIV14_05850 [Gammaproteobacteria bacterium]
MKRLFRRLLGKDPEPREWRPGVERRKKPRTSVSSIVANNPARFDPTRDEVEAAKPEPEPRKGPGLALDDRTEEGGDPYDPGSYKRPDIWQKIRKSDDS